MEIRFEVKIGIINQYQKFVRKKNHFNLEILKFRILLLIIFFFVWWELFFVQLFKIFMKLEFFHLSKKKKRVQLSEIRRGASNSNFLDDFNPIDLNIEIYLFFWLQRFKKNFFLLLSKFLLKSFNFSVYKY